ncbi:MAG TPA: hypothetical protein VF376_07155, partial [Thermoanaerobaculia bacterium]
VFDASPYLLIDASPDSRCPAGGFDLSVPGQFSSYLWQPGGETTPSIKVCPTNPTVYSVVTTDVSGCVDRGAVLLEPYRIGLIPRPPLDSPTRSRPRPIEVTPRETP